MQGSLLIQIVAEREGRRGIDGADPSRLIFGVVRGQVKTDTLEGYEALFPECIKSVLGLLLL